MAYRDFNVNFATGEEETSFVKIAGDWILISMYLCKEYARSQRLKPTICEILAFTAQFTLTMTENWYRDNRTRDVRDLQQIDRDNRDHGDPHDRDPDDHHRKCLLVTCSIISGLQREKIDHLRSCTRSTSHSNRFNVSQLST